jgi:hypothetical protein
MTIYKRKALFFVCKMEFKLNVSIHIYLLISDVVSGGWTILRACRLDVRRYERSVVQVKESH